jgi:hypothetical protein
MSAKHIKNHSSKPAKWAFNIKLAKWAFNIKPAKWAFNIKG